MLELSDGLGDVLGDAAEDYALPVWAGEVPLHFAAGTPRPDDRCATPVPAYLADRVRS